MLEHDLRHGFVAAYRMQLEALDQVLWQLELTRLRWAREVLAATLRFRCSPAPGWLIAGSTGSVRAFR